MRGWSWSFRISTPTLLSLTKEAMAFYLDSTVLRTALKLKLLIFFSSVSTFLKQDLEFEAQWADAGAADSYVDLHPCWFLVSLPLFHPGLIIFW